MGQGPGQMLLIPAEGPGEVVGVPVRGDGHIRQAFGSDEGVEGGDGIRHAGVEDGSAEGPESLFMGAAEDPDGGNVVAVGPPVGAEDDVSFHEIPPDGCFSYYILSPAGLQEARELRCMSDFCAKERK